MIDCSRRCRTKHKKHTDHQKLCDQSYIQDESSHKMNSPTNKEQLLVSVLESGSINMVMDPLGHFLNEYSQSSSESITPSSDDESFSNYSPRYVIISLSKHRTDDNE